MKKLLNQKSLLNQESPLDPAKQAKPKQQDPYLNLLPLKKISYSQLKVWNECPYKHKLSYLDEIEKFKGNIFTAFGTAVHSVCESVALKENKTSKEVFLDSFNKELETIETIDLTPKKIKTFEEQGLSLLPEISTFMEDHFADWEVFSTEEELFEDVDGFEGLKFKGFVDLVLKRGSKYTILDWKTCSWGWDARRRSDPMTVYQIMLYKMFFAQKHQIELDNIETCFGLLKRTAKNTRIEIVKLTSGPRRIKNALTLLEKGVKNINSGIVIKNRLSCKYCHYYKTEHCS